MKVALFGGSFNPVHNGHLEIANRIIKEMIADEVWFIPCRNHPFDKELISGQDRINMIKLAIDNLPKLRVIDLEILSNKISYTSETIQYLNDKFKEIEFYFIIGSDNLINLQKWHNFEYLRYNVKFILVKRPGFEIVNTLGIRVVHTLQMENKVSSTKIRDFLLNCNSVKEMIPNQVEQYIKREELYHEKLLCKSC